MKQSGPRKLSEALFFEEKQIWIWNVYQALCVCLNRVDSAALWPGFAPLRFTVYGQERCFFDGVYVEKTAHFCVNTAIKYNGERIAIGQVEEECDVEILASKMIHEMFHAFR